MDIAVEVWGDLACFSPPYAKVERQTYPFPTPSAARGILSAVYSKPTELFWRIKRIEVLNPIRYISIRRNEVEEKISTQCMPIYADEKRTQRQTIALQDVRYRITAEIVPTPAYGGRRTQLEEQALRRIRGGKAYYQPSFGCREFVAYFEESDGSRRPQPIDLDAGLMVYDVFDPRDNAVRAKAKPRLSLFHAVLRQGVLEVPDYDSPEVLKGGAPC